MQTKIRSQRASSIFNDKAAMYSPDTLKFISVDLMRTMFFGRIAQLQFSGIGKCELLDGDLRSAIHETAASIRRFDMKTKNKLQPRNAQWLSKELSKDKILDITNMVELAARVSNDGSETDYELFMSMLTDFLDRTIHLQSRRQKLNLKKYKALFRFLTEEMVAEVESGQTAVNYDEATDTLSFRLVQPDAQIPSKPIIK